MTRGRLPVRAQLVADPIAGKRGLVQHYRYEPGAVFSFTIFGKIADVQVRVKCVRRLGCTIPELEREYAEMLDAIRRTASGPGILREFWICSPRYAMRFFRVLDDGLVELDRDGTVPGTGA